MSTDATRMQDLCTYGLIAYSGVVRLPCIDRADAAQLQISIAFVSLYQLLGFYGLVGVAIMVLSLPLNAMIARLQTRLQKEQMKSALATTPVRLTRQRQGRADPADE